METPRTLAEMTPRERSCMIDVVVGSLEGFAEEAELDGDAKFAANSHAVACTITDTNLAESMFKHPPDKILVMN